jgi:hypothetical protein
VTDPSLRTAVPDALPVLERGSHRNPGHGACFMEYTSLLAGEPFSDEPRCVDPELAAVLRRANDRLPDAHRHLLLPLLGRSIGLVAGPPPPPWSWRLPAGARRQRRAEVARHRERTDRLHGLVAERFQRATGLAPAAPATLWSPGAEQLGMLFWDLVQEPVPVGSPEEQSRRLVARIELLHECYERALAEMRSGEAGRSPAAAEGAPAARA